MEVYNEYEPDELYHHGVKGQRWGIRRFQNKDGILTNAGEKHRRSLGQVVRDHKVKKKRVEALKKARETKAANKEAAEKAAAEAEKRKKLIEKGKLSPKKMTDEELKAALARKENEKKYNEAVLATSTGKRAITKIWNDGIVPGAAEGAKKVVSNLVDKKLSDALGLNTKEAKSEYDKLKEAADISKFKKQIYDNEHDLRNMIKRDKINAEKEQQDANRKKAYDEAAQKVKSYDNSGRYNIKFKEASKAGKQTTTSLLEDKSSNTPSPDDSKKGQAFLEDSRTGQLLLETSYEDLN
ncbi:MAG: hypothetical protein J6B01_04740 [Ruminococcus sp.]|nr:hypothetical protein [Ruminococcus sp.]